MVQRKAPDKLDIQADSKKYANSEKRSTASKSSTSQNPEIRNKGGPELKKMMKKSRSIKRSDFDSLRSNSMRAKSRPAKPPAPPAEVLVAVVIPQKPPLVMVTPQKAPQIKIPETSPNYMKSTSSSIARKERSQVSPHSSKTSCDSPPGRKDSNQPILSSVSGHKPARTLTKTSSLRPVRTLTKTSSNKAGRTSMKKTSGVALYTDQNVRRATCSSTLKDSKFPTYVTLHPGGTESEGTSVPKVCPYTYCSLNGHHHTQLPPLKCFLSARRRMLKNQKSMRLKSLSSVSRKPSEKPKDNINTGQIVFNEDPAIPEEDSAGSEISPLIKEGFNFFVEIYTQSRQDSSKSIERNTEDGNDEAKTGFSVDPWGPENTSFSDKDSATTEAENDGGRYAESLPDDSSGSAISFEDNIDHDTDFIMEEMDTSMFFLEYIQKEEADDGDYAPSYTQAVTGLGDFSTGNESEESENEGSVFDTRGMEWEDGEFVDTHLDKEADCSIVRSDHDPIVCLKGFTDTEPDSEHTLKPNDIVSNCYDEIPANEELQVVHGENNEEFDGVSQALEIELSSEIISKESNTSSSPTLQYPLPCSEDVIEKSVTVSDEKEGDPEIDEVFTIGVPSDAAEHPLEELIDTLLDDEISTCNTPVEHDTQLEEHEDNYSEPEIHHCTVPEDPDASTEVGMCLQEPEDKSQPFESVDLETDQGIATSKELNISNILPIADTNVDTGAKEAEEIQNQLKGKNIHNSTFFNEHGYTEGSSLKSIEECSNGSVKMKVEDDTGAEKTTIINAGCNPDKECPENCSKYNKSIRCKRIEEAEEPREFNPRGPRFLPLEPELDPETVDLRHQMMDERKNSEEWMVDYALQQAVSKLAPARMRKVALLVEAFETVIPLPKYEIHLPHNPTGFTHTRFMQACS